jgi:hypothetical protein
MMMMMMMMMVVQEKRKLEVVAGYQLMANSAARVFKGMKALDDIFTKRHSLWVFQ